MEARLKVKKYKTEGDIAWEYNPLRNLKKEDGTITDFQVDNSALGFDMNHPIDIECQQSYDGTVNLILNDNNNVPRIINSRFTNLENNRYKIINRNQIKQTNLYDEEYVDRETRLFRNIQSIPKLSLNKVSYFGQLMGGNYTFYLKYADEDYNQTDIVAETGMISIFHGTFENPKTCSGAFMDERTDKSIILTLSNIDTSFVYFNLYFTRTTCDRQGVQIKKAYKININYEIENEYKLISINGFEDIEEIGIDELNIHYNVVDRVKTQAQVQNRLFFANVNEPIDNETELRNLSLHIIAKETQDEKSIGFVEPGSYSPLAKDATTQVEYYSPLNIYYKLGYFPGEIYRFGIVYLYEDDHLSSVYNLRGIDFNSVEFNEDNVKLNYKYDGEIKEIPYKDFLDDEAKSYLSNTAGVFRFTKQRYKEYTEEENYNVVIDFKDHKVLPIGIQFTFPDEVLKRLTDLKIKGFFFVRQNRIPVFLAQGFSIGVDGISYVPMLRDGEEDGKPRYLGESFLSKSKTLVKDYESRKITSTNKQSSGLICVDAFVNKQLQSMFNSEEFKLDREVVFKDTLNKKQRLFSPIFEDDYDREDNTSFWESTANLIYVDQEIPQRSHNDYGFSTKAGLQEELKHLSCFGSEVVDDANFTNYVRGIYGAFIGTTTDLKDNCLYSIYGKNMKESFLQEYFTVRIRDKSPFYAITERYNIESPKLETKEGKVEGDFKEFTETTSENYKDTILTKNWPDRASCITDYSYLYELREYLKFIEEYKDSIVLDGKERPDKNDKKYENNEEAYKKDLEEYNNTVNLIIDLLNDTDPQLIRRNKKDFPTKAEVKVNYWTYTLPITYRGDCFTNTVTHRLQRNFVSPSVPVNDSIIDPNTWKDNFKGEQSTEDWNDISKADVDAVPIGTWFSYKCLSNFNLGLRSLDPFNVDEKAIMGNDRSFHPRNSLSVKASNKISESDLYNTGYNTTLGYRRNFNFERVPYTKDIFDTRIMFSDLQVDGDFKNSYKIFQGLAYEDLDRQYGGITKILPWADNLLCIFEHAIAIVSINPKSVISTTTGNPIHMYGTSVIDKHMTIISDMYGSSWKDSVIRTTRAVYGVDTSAKKIWRIDTQNGFVCISDFTIQRWLNDNLDLKELEKTPLFGTRNVKTHFNAYKNDVMFTFYNRDKIWNICYNEIRQNWITRYSWTPLLSENVNNSFFSFDLLRTRVFSIINNNLRNREDSELVTDTQWDGIWKLGDDKNLSFFINKDYTSYNVESVIIKGTKYEDDSLKEDVILDTNTFEYGISYQNKTFYSNDKVSISINNLVSSKSENSEDKQKEDYSYYKEFIEDKENPLSIVFYNSGRTNKSSDYLYYTVEFKYKPYLITDMDSSTNTEIVHGVVYGAYTRSYNVGLIIDYSSIPDKDSNNEYSTYITNWNTAFLSRIYGHGRAINADEINYFNYLGPKSKIDQILPTRWYDRQEPFEFEIVVNSPQGIHKIFDNLVIMSNNAEPESLEIEIVGDVYDFNKRRNYLSHHFPKELKDLEPKDPPFDKARHLDVEFEPVVLLSEEESDKDKLRGKNVPSPITYETRVEWDPILDEYTLVMHQDLADMAKYGRRIGNIHYVEDSWRITLQPIYYTALEWGEDDEGNPIIENSIQKSTRVRDKWAKIRVKYSGKRLALITAIQTIMTQSYA